MKKVMSRIMKGLVGAVAMCILFCGITVFAEEPAAVTDTSILEIGDVMVVEDGVYTGNIPSGVTYDQASGTLTLEDYMPEKYMTWEENPVYPSIRVVGNEDGSKGSINIVLKGNNRIGRLNCNIANTILKGDGVLECNLDGMDTDSYVTPGIFAKNFTMESGTLNIVGDGQKDFCGMSGQAGYAFQFLGGTVNINCGNGQGKGEHAGIDMYGDLTIQNAVVNIELGLSDTGSWGLWAGGTLTIENGTVGIHVEEGNGTHALACITPQFSNSLYYYVGEQEANRQISLDEVFQMDGDHHVCSDNYLVITPTKLTTMSFSDVKPDNWYYEYVKAVFEKGIMTGLNEHNFGASQKLSREQFATILYRMSGSPEVGYESKFPDVPDGQFYTAPVMWASSEDVGVVTGYMDGRFGTSDKITREQMALMMYRYAKFMGLDVSASAEYNTFPDGNKVSGFAADAMHWTVGSGMISGNLDGTLAPQGDASRAVCATIIVRFMDMYGL